MTGLTEIETHERRQSGLLITCLCLGEEKIQKQKTVTQKNQTRGLICKNAFRFLFELCRTVGLCPICKRISIIRNLTDAEDQEFFENPFMHVPSFL